MFLQDRSDCLGRVGFPVPWELYFDSAILEEKFTLASIVGYDETQSVTLES